MIFHRFGLFIFSILIVFLCAPTNVFGQCGGTNEPPCSNVGFVDSSDPENIGVYSTGSGRSFDAPALISIVITLVNWFSWFIGVIAVVMGLYAGYLFITGGGEPAQLQTARKTLLWAIVGVSVAILAFAVVAITTAIMGL